MFPLVHSGTFTMHMQAFLLWHFEWFIQLHWCETFSFHCLLTRIFYLPLLLECVCACVCVCAHACVHMCECVSTLTYVCVWGSSFLSSIFSTIYHLISSLGLQAISKFLRVFSFIFFPEFCYVTILSVLIPCFSEVQATSCLSCCIEFCLSLSYV